MHSLKVAFLLVFSLGLSACFNDNHERSIVLGNVSLGDQLIDLKKAHEAGAISNGEYQQMRESLINLVADEDFDSDDEDNDERVRKDKPSGTDEDEEGFSWL